MEENVKLAIYARLSLEDGLDDNEVSVSVENQIALGKEFADKNNYKIVDIYFDDGYSGTNFDRPSFRRLIDDIENGKINTIVVKDLSRFGRNFLKVSYYLENYFRMKQIRFISLSESYDSFSAEEDDMSLAIRNFLNGYYCKECRKKRLDYIDRVKEKDSLASEGIYGYYLERKKWLVDEEAANVVKMIFKMFNENSRVSSICDYLKKNEVLTISNYKYERFKKKHSFPKTAKGLYEWNNYSVYQILNSEEYTGVALNLKRIRPKGNHNQVKNFNPVRLENHHEAIISTDTYEKAQQRLEKRRIPIDSSRDEYRLKNMLFDENGQLYYYAHQKYKGKILSRKYYVNNDFTNGFDAKLIHSILYKDISIIIKRIVKDENYFMETYMKKNKENFDKNEGKRLKSKLSELNKNKNELFEQMLLDLIPLEEFNEQEKRIKDEINSTIEAINNQTIAEASENRKKNNLIKFVNLVSSLDPKINELELIRILIKKVTLYKKDGKLKIKIEYNFISSI